MDLRVAHALSTATAGSPAPVAGLAFHPTKEHLFIAIGSEILEVHLATGARRAVLSAPAPITALAVNPAHVVAATAAPASVQVWALDSSKLLHSIQPSSKKNITDPISVFCLCTYFPQPTRPPPFPLKLSKQTGSNSARLSKPNIFSYSLLHSHLPFPTFASIYISVFFLSLSLSMMYKNRFIPTCCVFSCSKVSLD